MKPHPSIFQAALQLVNVEAADAMMVGDSVRQDVEGALRAGMRARAAASGLRATSGAAASLPSRRSRRYWLLARVTGAHLLVMSIRDLDLLQPGGQCMVRPPSRCRWMWKTVCPASRLVLKTVRKPPAEIPRSGRSPRPAAPSRRRAHRLRTLRSFSEAMCRLGTTRHVRRRLRVDVVEGEQRVRLHTRSSPGSRD